MRWKVKETSLVYGLLVEHHPVGGDGGGQAER